MLPEKITTAQIQWEPAVFDGKIIEGVFSKTLRFDQDNKRPIRLLLKIDAGASYPAHKYPGGDDIYVLEGEVQYGKYLLKKNDYLLAPPNSSLEVSSDSGCILFYALSK
jgi:anti-sigma factor ChrR (cupin superfamily)